MAKVNNEEASILSSVASVASIVNKILAGGVEVGQLAEKIASVLDPALEPDIASLVTVLQEVQKLMGSVT